MGSIERFVIASKKLHLAVADLVEVDRISRLQSKDLALAEADGNQVIHEDWHEAVRAVAAASVEYDAAEKDT